MTTKKRHHVLRVGEQPLWGHDAGDRARAPDARDDDQAGREADEEEDGEEGEEDEEEGEEEQQGGARGGVRVSSSLPSELVCLLVELILWFPSEYGRREPYTITVSGGVASPPKSNSVSSREDWW